MSSPSEASDFQIEVIIISSPMIMTIIGASAGSAPSTMSVHDSESIRIIDTGIIIDKKRAVQ